MLLLLLAHDLLKQGPLLHLLVGLGGHRWVQTWSDQLSMYYKVYRDVKDRELGLRGMIVHDIVYAEKPYAFFW